MFNLKRFGLIFFLFGICSFPKTSKNSILRPHIVFAKQEVSTEIRGTFPNLKFEFEIDKKNADYNGNQNDMILFLASSILGEAINKDLEEKMNIYNDPLFFEEFIF